jgi:hypothetical protein
MTVSLKRAIFILTSLLTNV